MATDTVLLRCASCGSINRVKRDRLGGGPRCGKCGAVLTYPRRPVDVNNAAFQKEILSAPGVVLVEFWSPT
jgi:thioredoxin 2